MIESIGRFVLKKSGHLTLLLLLCIGPCFSLLFLSFRSTSYRELLYTYQTTARKAKIALQNREKRDRFIQSHLKSDPSYLAEHFESIPLLTRERQALSELYHHPAVADRDSLKRRLASIERKQNHLAFNEREILTSKTCVETIEKMRQPIELSLDDLHHVLSKIEQDGSHCPQFTVIKFHLQRTDVDGELRTHLTDLELLKREFLKP